MAKLKTLIPARDEDGTLYWIPSGRHHRYAVALDECTTPILAALLQDSALTAAELVNAALLAVWLAKVKKETPRATRSEPTKTTPTPTYVGDILKGLRNGDRPKSRSQRRGQSEGVEQ